MMKKIEEFYVKSQVARNTAVSGCYSKLFDEESYQNVAQWMVHHAGDEREMFLFHKVVGANLPAWPCVHFSRAITYVCARTLAHLCSLPPAALADHDVHAAGGGTLGHVTTVSAEEDVWGRDGRPQSWSQRHWGHGGWPQTGRFKQLQDDEESASDGRKERRCAITGKPDCRRLGAV